MKKNKRINPCETFEFSNTKVWWKCQYGHSFLQVISKRTIRKDGCPYCSGRFATEDKNLLQLYPSICKEWDFDKNSLTSIKPEQMCCNSDKTVWWKCGKNHSWKAKIRARTQGGTNCPFCNGISLKNGILCDSKAEAIKYIEFIKNNYVFEHHKVFYTMANNKRQGRLTYDFYFPNENKYIEVTSYTQENLKHISGRYFGYLRKIVKKRMFAENILGANFEFVQFYPSAKQMQLLREFMV